MSSTGGGSGEGGAWPRYSASRGRKYLNFRPDRTVAVVSAAPGARSSCAFWNSLVPRMEAAAKKTCEEQQLLRIAEESKFRPLRKRRVQGNQMVSLSRCSKFGELYSCCFLL